MESIFNELHATLIHNVVEHVQLYQWSPTYSKCRVALVFAHRRVAISPSNTGVAVVHRLQFLRAHFLKLGSLYFLD